MDKSTCESKRSIHHPDGLVLSTLQPSIDPIGYFDADRTDPTVGEHRTYAHAPAQAWARPRTTVYGRLRSSKCCCYLHHLSPKSQRFLLWCRWQGLCMQYDFERHSAS